MTSIIEFDKHSKDNNVIIIASIYIYNLILVKCIIPGIIYNVIVT